MVDFDFGHDGLGDDFESPHRKRVWMALCYPDNENMNNWWVNVLPGLEVGYVGRIHDQEGKSHNHVVFVFNEAKTLSACAKNVSYEERWLRPWDSKRKAMRYLCHCDNPEKYQYSVDGLYGSLVDEATRYCSKSSQESETKTVADIIGLLDCIDGYVSFTDFCRVCVDKGYWSVFRRMGAMGSRLIDEHNAAYQKFRQIELMKDKSRFDDYVFSGMSKKVPFAQYVEMIEKNGFPTHNSL